ncbi:uncharacterized protein LOC114370325 [Glycine soja]|uniref:uncharacterized protein LOC114370325 n=1 Tax=Glycine soja TaxID=3848 RepID=UPI00103E58D3|nr:uncharacterized protein LOC114370325 [Glycine soja]
MALHGKNKYGFVDGSIPELDLGHSTHALWHHNDSIISSWLLNSLSKEMQVSILHCSSAKAIWDDLQVRFDQCNGPLIFQLKHELIILQQGSMYVSSFYSKLHSLWESLSELKPSHSCTCGRIKPWCDFEQIEYAMQFLMGLNESFSTIRGQILSMDPFPSVTKVFALVVQEEKQKEVGASTSGTSASEVSHVFAFKNSSTAQNNSEKCSIGSSKNRPLCAHCGMLGHTQDRCFKLHGYPPNYKKTGYSSEVKKHYSSSSSEPPHKVAQQVSVDMPHSQPSSGDLGSQFQLIAQQYSQLMNLLESHATNVVIPHGVSSASGMILSTSTSNFLHDCWLLDSGASIHITCSLHHFLSYQLVYDKIVTLPNSDIIPILAIGSVCLTNTLVLHNVAYIPKFKFNLISVSVLLTNPNLSISFSQNEFDIQEKQACKRIGRGDLIQGLYVLDLKDTHD